MSLKKRVKLIFSNPKRKLKAEFPQLSQLRDDLKKAEELDPLNGIVYFFDKVSRWHDRGIGDLINAFNKVNYGQYEETVNDLEKLQRHFKNAGRCPHGFNRTGRGQTVTEDDVFLGDIYGLFTQTVSFWKKKKDEIEYPGMPPAYEVISRQAKRFMVSHIQPMVEILGRLEKLAA